MEEPTAFGGGGGLPGVRRRQPTSTYRLSSCGTVVEQLVWCADCEETVAPRPSAEALLLQELSQAAKAPLPS